jgi:hypothetical protein
MLLSLAELLGGGTLTRSFRLALLSGQGSECGGLLSLSSTSPPPLLLCRIRPPPYNPKKVGYKAVLG